MSDYRVKSGHVLHIKTLRMMARLGDRSFYSLHCLWAYATESATSGDLHGMSSAEIAGIAHWLGDPGMFTSTLVEVGYLDGKEGRFRLHDWQEEQPWVQERQRRSAAGRKNATTRWEKEKYHANGTDWHCDSHDKRNASGNAPSLALPSTTDPRTASPNGDVAPTPAPQGRAKRQYRIALDVETGEWSGITNDDRTTWTRAYPGIDLDGELAKAVAWVKADPAHRRKSNWGKFLASWFARSQDRASRYQSPLPFQPRIDPSEAAWAEALSAMREFTGAPGDREMFASLVQPGTLAAVDAIGGPHALMGARDDPSRAGFVQRQFSAAWRSAHA